MPRQNRVTPFGEIVAYAERGTLMGNRGILHDEHGQLTGRQWQHRAWIACRLEFKGRHETIMQPGHYTQLFFLDEATALAAGHRPCGECRREDNARFKALWLQTNGALLGDAPTTVNNIDRIIHAERVDRTGRQRTYTSNLDLLANGTFITLADPTWAYLVWNDELREWSPAGYRRTISRPRHQDVTVLTPASIARTLATGYIPGIY